MYRLSSFLLLCIPFSQATACLPDGDVLSHIRGQVIDERTHQPVKGASVELVLGFGTVCSILTDADGRFHLVMPPGIWTFAVYPAYPAYEWEAYDNTRSAEEVTTFNFAGGEDVDVGTVAVGPPAFELFGTSMTTAGQIVRLSTEVVNNTAEAAELVVWAMLFPGKKACKEPCGPGAFGILEPEITPSTIEAPPGSTHLDLEFSLPKRLPPDARYRVTLYAARHKWDALTHSAEVLELRPPAGNTQ